MYCMCKYNTLETSKITHLKFQTENKAIAGGCAEWWGKSDEEETQEKS